MCYLIIYIHKEAILHILKEIKSLIKNKYHIDQTCLQYPWPYVFQWIMQFTK